MKQVAIIGDVHGCYKTLCSLLDKIHSNYPDAEIVFAGDLVDRGPSSRRVVQLVIDNGFKCIQGNHEQMMYTDVLEYTEYPGSWEMNGGKEARKSYKGFSAQLISHSIWMENLPHYIEFPDVRNENGDMLVVSHSSIQDFWEYRDTQADNIMWNRNPVSTSIGMRQGIFNVFGHTPTPEPQIGEFHANIDTGCVFKRVHYGKLTALLFPSMEILQQENID